MKSKNYTLYIQYINIYIYKERAIKIKNCSKIIKLHSEFEPNEI